MLTQKTWYEVYVKLNNKKILLDIFDSLEKAEDAKEQLTKKDITVYIEEKEI